MENQSRTTKLIKSVVAGLQKVGKICTDINQRMENKYTPKLIALVTAFFIAILTIFILFIPNYLGVADDGSLSKVMNTAGLQYIQEDSQDIYNNYFVKTYSNVAPTADEVNPFISSHVMIVKAAVFLDNVFSRDKLFDIRFLGLIYTVLYIPAVYLLIRQACMRGRNFLEGVAIGTIGCIIFSDVSYITYFNSFYPEAVWFISFMYCVALALSFQEKRNMSDDLICLSGFLLAASVLIISKNQCGIIGIILAVYCVKLLFARENWAWKMICVLASIFLCFMSVVSIVNLASDFNQTSKIHAMTRGVLFTSTDPASTLAEFGIDSSYEMLTDASTYDFLPFVAADEKSLQTGFLDKYEIPDISAYYVRHPVKLLHMIDISIISSFDVRRSYCGNYEKSVGLPEKAQSIFWSAWSTFKNTSAPKTIGFLILLVIAVFLLFGRHYSLRPVKDRRDTVFLDVLLTVLFVLLSQSFITIINSGDAEMTQHCFLVGLGMDILIYFVFAEIVHKLNIL